MSVYADKKYNDEQMEQIRMGLERDVDVSLYADTKYDWKQMMQLRKGLEAKLDVSIYADKKYDWDQMEQIRYGLEDGLNMSIYADKYNGEQMEGLRLGLEAGFDISIYANPNYAGVLMWNIFWALKAHKDLPWLDALADFSSQHPEYNELLVHDTDNNDTILYSNNKPIAVFIPEQGFNVLKKNPEQEEAIDEPDMEL